MSSDPLPDNITSKQQKPHPESLSPSASARLKKFGDTRYKPIFAKACYDLLSKSRQAKTKAHCCSYLQCSKPTLLLWMKKYPEFGKAIEAGLKIGEAKWRQRIAQHAFKPTSEVNNGLIKLLSANVYGIKDDSDAPAVTINTTVNQNPEETMRNRGIPIPEIDNEDVVDDD